MNRLTLKKTLPAFALPAVMIAAVVMMMVLVSGLSATTSINSGLRQQHSAKLRKQAAESGLAMAKYCMGANGGSITWTNSTPLKPNTDCSGVETTSCPVTSTNDVCYVSKGTGYRTTFEVGVILDSSNNPTGINSKGIYRNVRASDGTKVNESTQTLKMVTQSASVSIASGTLALGGYTHCGIASDDKAYCWGYNGYGQIGDGTTTSRYTPTAVAQGAMPSGATFKSLTAGYYHICGIASDDKAYCWGYNGYGQLGDGGTGDRYNPMPVAQGAMPSGATFKSLTAGSWHTCGIASDDKAYCWGYNPYAQLGDGGTSNRYMPTAVAQGAMPSGAMVKSLSAGYYHTCSIASDDKAYCWGLNNNGHVGDGTTSGRSTPTAVAQGAMPSGATVKSVTAGMYNTCGIASDDKAYCWGNNDYGQIGDGTTSGRSTPTAVAQGAMPSGYTVKSISISSSYHACSIASDNKAYCWGRNNYGVIGDSTTTSRYTPTAVAQGAMPSGATFKLVNAGLYNTCSIASDDKAYCWGYNSYGQIGDGTTSQRNQPALVLQINEWSGSGTGSSPNAFTSY
jgi:alpha-tubulin suppressor-like RCC1 family protein